MTGGSREPSWEMRATLILDHAAQPSVYRVIDDDRFVEKDISIEAGLVSLMKFIDSFVRFFIFFLNEFELYMRMFLLCLLIRSVYFFR